MENGVQEKAIFLDCLPSSLNKSTSASPKIFTWRNMKRSGGKWDVVVSFFKWVLQVKPVLVRE